MSNGKPISTSIILCYLLFLFAQVTTSAQEIHIYTDAKKTKYLGCLTCSKYSSVSIWNEYGTYGSPYNYVSVWNQYGTYGSPYNATSPWNEYSSKPPILLDEYGNSYGYFTRNLSVYGRTTDQFAVWVLDNYEYIVNNFSKVVNKLN
jgi:hypothetical protein